MSSSEIDSVLINTPVSSPLHVQLNLPLLKAHLVSHGFRSRVIDSNILFFHQFLGDGILQLGREECDRSPISILAYYNDLEATLQEKSQAFDGLAVGLRSLTMKHDRIFFDSVLNALDEPKENPFIRFYQNLVEETIAPAAPKIAGIAITFQDQIIPSLTLAAVLREQMPDLTIVWGGQMVTRCHDSLIKHDGIRKYFDYLALWDGEAPLLNIHRKVLRGEQVDFTNVVEVGGADPVIDRAGPAIRASEIPGPDFSDIAFERYFFPEILVPLQTTRGCYANCAFCAIPFGSNSYRVRKGEKVISDILDAQEITRAQTGRAATYFKFMEDTSSPKLLLDVAELIESRGIDAKWETFARLEKAFARPGMMEQLYRGGCRKIHWGLESNDPNILLSMNKKVKVSYSNEVMQLAADAGIMNFCFILVGFPGETDEMREALTRYIIGNENIHTLTISTFDLTRNSPMEQEFTFDNEYKLDMAPAEDFQVRLPYTVDGEEWKPKIVPAAHKMMIAIVKERPDIGFVTLFPDQIRSMFCDKYGNDWGRTFVERYGAENVREMLLNTENYVRAYESKSEMDPAALPEPLKREHFRTKEDMKLLACAVFRRREYETRRIEQV